MSKNYQRENKNILIRYYVVFYVNIKFLLLCIFICNRGINTRSFETPPSSSCCCKMSGNSHVQKNCSIIYSNLSFYDSLTNKLMDDVIIKFLTIIIFLVLTGIIVNSFAFVIFHRLKWFTNTQMLFFVHSTICDFTLCTLALLYGCGYAVITFFEITTPKSQLACMLVSLMFTIPYTCTTRFALIIAVDRLVSQLAPITWYHLGKRYHYILICGAWAWSAIQECGYFFFYQKGVCVILCLGYISYPPSTWWTTVGKVSDITVVACIIIIYVLIPVVTRITLRTCVNQTLMYRNNNFFYYRQYVAQVRLISMIMIPFFIFSSLITNVFSYFKGSTLHAEIIIILTSFCFGPLLSVAIPFVYLIDFGYRREAFKLIVSFKHCFKKS